MQAHHYGWWLYTLVTGQHGKRQAVLHPTCKLNVVPVRQVQPQSGNLL